MRHSCTLRKRYAELAAIAPPADVMEQRKLLGRAHQQVVDEQTAKSAAEPTI